MPEDDPTRRDGEGRQLVGPLLPIPATLRRFGVAPAQALAAAGLPADALDDPAATIPFAALTPLVTACVALTGCPWFGLLAGQGIRVANFGPVGALMRSAPTLGEALLDFTGNQHRHTRGAMPYLLGFGETTMWGYAVLQPGMAALSQILDYSLAAGCAMLHELAGLAPEEVLLAHAAPADATPYRQAFPAPVRFDAEQSALVLPTALLSRPLAWSDPARRRALLEQVAHYWAVREPGLAARVLRLLRPRVVVDPPDEAGAAAQFGLHPRTLRRRLRAEGTSFRRLLNQARLEAARQLLAATRIEVTQIAMAFGYADASAFTRAFHRSTGLAPRQWRAGMRADP